MLSGYLYFGYSFSVPSQLCEIVGSSQIEYEDKYWVHKRDRVSLTSLLFMLRRLVPLAVIVGVINAVTN